MPTGSALSSHIDAAAALRVGGGSELADPLGIPAGCELADPLGIPAGSPSGSW